MIEKIRRAQPLWGKSAFLRITAFEGCRFCFPMRREIQFFKAQKEGQMRMDTKPLKGNEKKLLILLVLVLSTACPAWRSEGSAGLEGQNNLDRVSYESEGIRISGKLWLPADFTGPRPALVLVDGSGRTNADRLKGLSAILNKRGFACLTYDKRGVGLSGGEYLGGLDIDIPLLAKDVVAAVNYLKTRQEIDSAEIGLLGFSQAGWIIPVAASLSQDVSYTAIIGGPTVSLGEENYYSQLTGKDPGWSFIYGNLSRDEISRRLAERGPSLFDPWPYLKKMNAPGLWLYGELDRSQPTRESVAILDRLIKDFQKDFTYKVFKGADHSMQVDGKQAEGLRETLTDWLLNQVEVRVDRPIAKEEQ